MAWTTLGRVWTFLKLNALRRSSLVLMMNFETGYLWSSSYWDLLFQLRPGNFLNPSWTCSLHWGKLPPMISSACFIPTGFFLSFSPGMCFNFLAFRAVFICHFRRFCIQATLHERNRCGNLIFGKFNSGRLAYIEANSNIKTPFLIEFQRQPELNMVKSISH